MFTRTVQAGVGQQQRPRREQELPNRQECKGDVTAGTPEVREAKTRSQGTGAQMREGGWRVSKRPRDPVPATRGVSGVSSLPRRMQVQMAYRGVRNPFRSSRDSKVEKRKPFALLYELGQPGCLCSQPQRPPAQCGQSRSQRAGAHLRAQPGEVSFRKGKIGSKRM